MVVNIVRSICYRLKNMELNSLRLENHDFEANTKGFVIGFDNLNSSKGLIHSLVKINLIKLISTQ